MISGFTIIRNGEKLGYPYKEALLSLAPLCDEIVVALGDCDDETPAAMEKLRKEISCELRILHSPWNDQNIKGGSELARQTNIALENCKYEICFYIQADESLHEKDYEKLRSELEHFAIDDDVQALALRWRHFYGNFSTWVQSRKWYRREVRVIKKSSGLKSYGDAQGFRIPHSDGTWTKARAALSQAEMYHYGWVRPPETMAKKSEALDRFWHGHARDGVHTAENVYPILFGMQHFEGGHPQHMLARVDALKNFDPFLGQKLPKNLSYLRNVLSNFVEEVSGWRMGEFKNFRLTKRY